MKGRQCNGQKKGTKGQTTMYKTLHRKLKIQQQKFKRRQNSFKILCVNQTSFGTIFSIVQKLVWLTHYNKKKVTVLSLFYWLKPPHVTHIVMSG
jgi:hypothetical protein